MARKRNTPETIIRKLREAEVLQGQGSFDQREVIMGGRFNGNAELAGERLEPLLDGGLVIGQLEARILFPVVNGEGTFGDVDTEVDLR